MDDFWLYVLKGILLLVLIVSSKARSVGLFLFGLIGMILIFVGIFEHGDYMSDLSIFEILFFIGLMFFMRRNYVIAKGNERSLILSQLNPVRKLGSYFTILMGVSFVVFIIGGEVLDFNMKSGVEGFFYSNLITISALILMSIAFYRGSLDIKNTGPTDENVADGADVEIKKEAV